MSDYVPITRSLNEIYYEEAVPAKTTRWESLYVKFNEVYGRRASFVARSPGRVNIIGEHIDYNMYEVLPMAIESDMLLATSFSGSSTSQFIINIANVDDKYPTRTFSFPLDGEIAFDSKVHDWANYFKAGLCGALEYLRKDPEFKPVNMDVVVDGSIPPAGGLSSSGAFVVASSLAVLVANGIKEVNRLDLTEMAIVSERAIGLNGGGMDQAASIFGTQGSAIYVSFTPKLSAEPIRFPKMHEDFCFVIAQTFVESVKHKTAPVHYNLRAVECSLAAAILFSLSKLENPLTKDITSQRVTLREFQTTYFDANVDAETTGIENQLETLIALAEQKLEKEEGYTREEMATLLSMPVEELEARFMTAFPVKATYFKLRQRSIHVFTEALRVHRFMNLLQQVSTKTDNSLGKELGDLMNQSQQSCRDIYECSSPEIDELCRIAQDEGANGSRLTGAGWGGCTVHLMAVNRVNAVKEAWHKRYYAKMTLSPEQMDGAVVVSKPGNGSAIYLK